MAKAIVAIEMPKNLSELAKIISDKDKEEQKMDDNKKILLKAAYDLLKKCDEGIYVKNVLAEKVNYAGGEGDGYSLMIDIENELELWN